jgi:hypothetical protein
MLATAGSTAASRIRIFEDLVLLIIPTLTPVLVVDADNKLIIEVGLVPRSPIAAA